MNTMGNGFKNNWIIEGDVTCTCPICGFQTGSQALRFRHCPNCGEMLITFMGKDTPKSMSEVNSDEVHFCGNCKHYDRNGICRNTYSRYWSAYCVYSFECEHWELNEEDV